MLALHGGHVLFVLEGRGALLSFKVEVSLSTHATSDEDGETTRKTGYLATAELPHSCKPNLLNSLFQLADNVGRTLRYPNLDLVKVKVFLRKSTDVRNAVFNVCYKAIILLLYFDKRLHKRRRDLRV